MPGQLISLIAAAAIDIDATLGIQMVLFLAFMLVLHPLLLKPYLKAVDLRREGVQGSREEAAEFEARAEAAISDYEERMREARRDAADVRESLRNEAQKEEKDILAEAREEVAKTLAEERTRIDEQVADAREELEKRSETLATMMVDKILPET